MRPIFLATCLALLAHSPGNAQTDDAAVAAAATQAAETGIEPVDPMEPRDAAELTLEEFRWVARPIIVFADTPADPRFIEQMQLLAARPDPLMERDVVIIVDTNPDARSEIRRALRPRGFALVVLQKDGAVGFRRKTALAKDDTIRLPALC